jgi:branched-chain amino acid transport system permease protein
MLESSAPVLQAVFYGTFNGLLYALVAVGIVLIFRSTRTINFAHGHFAVLGGFIFLQLSVLMQLPVLVGVAGAAAVVATGAYVWGRIARGLARGGDSLVPLIGSLGVFIALDGVLIRVWGGQQPYRIPALLPRLNLELGPLVVDSVYLWIGLAAVCVGLLLAAFFSRTNLGLQMRAAVQNPEAAELVGIPTARLALYAWIAGSLLALLALLLYVPRSFLENTAMMGVLIRAFAASSVGGFDSFGGVLVGALVLGVAEALAGRFIASSLQSVVALVMVALLMLASPRGVFVVRGERS